MLRRALATAVVLAGLAPMQAEGRTQVAAAFKVPTVTGQKVRVAADSGHVSITASTADREAGRHESAIYEAPGRVDNHRLRAQLGRFGSIDMRFDRQGQPREYELGDCTFTSAKGVFTGEASYAGEGLAAAASTTRAPGVVRTAEGRGCGVVAGRPKRERSRKATALEIFQRPREGYVAAQTLLAIRDKRLGTSFSATRITFEGRVLIGHFAGIEAPRRSFTFNRLLTTASIAPPAPLSGSAIFDGSGRRGAVTGDVAYGPFDLPPFPFPDGRVRATLERVPIEFTDARARVAQLARYAGK